MPAFVDRKPVVFLKKRVQLMESVNDKAYGLIHYDFQTDNVFWRKKTGQLSVIDFDDSMYHWFAMDIAAALADQLEDENPEGEAQLQAFVRGYRSVRPME
ncbi:phosphotransferase enzyme family protein [Paenibacillus elgii]|uniref:phosphotransferase enzyme family protein n=1 Tax=Paenibacillus elgii TaxID=189691 RepID=UPI000248DC91|nr:phosphotransferase [Paenibacillus elgii]